MPIDLLDLAAVVFPSKVVAFYAAVVAFLCGSFCAALE